VTREQPRARRPALAGLSAFIHGADASLVAVLAQTLLGTS